jgi:hypothetical protein
MSLRAGHRADVATQEDDMGSALGVDRRRVARDLPVEVTEDRRLGPLGKGLVALGMVVSSVLIGTTTLILYKRHVEYRRRFRTISVLGGLTWCEQILGHDNSGYFVAEQDGWGKNIRWVSPALFPADRGRQGSFYSVRPNGIDEQSGGHDIHWPGEDVADAATAQ